MGDSWGRLSIDDRIWLLRRTRGDRRSHSSMGVLVLSMSFFLYIVYELLVGLAAATASEADPQIARKIHTAQVMTVISWCTYPFVYLFPMFGFSAAKPVVSIQVGYCNSDIISKCGVGIVIYQISYAKSGKKALLQ